ncbi:tetratricopeptide repeat protein [Amycolatopsis roodepoortensis]|uniref:tetratricopeptide repeat protein n=1 Tax=Amycolatopsis roodepoortensis TaxID=700274 RepID=UPI00214BB901|nr:tetratricopeptide repeat protein [Amycolatopsis roodepoortensis]UUV32216.1 tetratricopeptide repeat protein [Amycolatopsis roodepoortensis]
MTRAGAWRGWGLVTGAVVLAGGTGAAILWLSGPAAAAIGSVLAVAVYGVASARGRALVERRIAQREALPEHVLSGRLRRVCEADDPILLRVHPAGARNDKPDDRIPPYVLRDFQPRLLTALAGGGFVLLVGDSTAGKTRAAYEAMREVLPDHVLVAPSTRASLDTVLPTALGQRRCVVWLDDLERFLGAGGLTATMTARMLGDGDRDVLILATMRTAEHDRYSVRQQDTVDGRQEAWRAGREVLELAQVIDVRREWSDAELRRAADYIDDPRIRTALRHCPQFGLAEALAAGPELAQDWRNAWRAGAHPRGAALVAAAVGCRRAGLHEPVPVSLLAELAEDHLARRQGPLLRPEPLDDALAWATTVSHGTSSLLLPTRQPGYYLAFDYLVDLTGHAAISPATWHRLIEHATPAQAFDIGTAARGYIQYPAAAAAFTKAAASSVPDADIMLADAIGSLGDLPGAERMLEEAVARRIATIGPDNPGTLRARFHLALMTSYTAEFAAAATRLESLVSDQQRVLGSGHTDTLTSRMLLANFVGMAGDPSRAADLSTRLRGEAEQSLGPNHIRTLAVRHQICFHLWLGGEVRKALELATCLITDMEEALGSDHPHILRSRCLSARFVGEVGDAAQAVELLEHATHDRSRVLGTDHHHVLSSRFSLAHWQARAEEHDAALATFTDALTRWEDVHGPGNPARLMATDGLPTAEDERLPNTPLCRKELADFLWTCQQLLGQEHPLTIDSRRLLSQLREAT